MMTRKHYIMIAKTINQVRDVKAGINTLAYQLAVDFSGDNPNFDYAKFIKACGIEDTTIKV